MFASSDVSVSTMLYFLVPMLHTQICPEIRPTSVRARVMLSASPVTMRRSVSFPMSLMTIAVALHGATIGSIVTTLSILSCRRVRARIPIWHIHCHMVKSHTCTSRVDPIRITGSLGSALVFIEMCQYGDYFFQEILLWLGSRVVRTSWNRCTVSSYNFHL